MSGYVMKHADEVTGETFVSDYESAIGRNMKPLEDYLRSVNEHQDELDLDNSLETKITLHVLGEIVDRIEELKQHVNSPLLDEVDVLTRELSLFHYLKREQGFDYAKNYDHPIS